MLTLIEALNYRCLKYVRQPLSPFHVLVGPNASGKTTFLDVVSLLGRLVSSGLKEALAERAPTFDDLLYLGKGNKFELAVEARIPDHLLDAVKTSKSTFQVIRYEVSIGKDSETEEVMLLGESVRLKTSQEVKSVKRQLFPSPPPPPDTIFERKQQGTRTTVNKVHCGNDNFYSETYTTSGKGWAPAFKLGPLKSALGNLPEDESKFPVSTWLKGLLSDGIHQVILESLAMRKASKPGQSRIYQTDGSNLPWVIEDLKKKDSRRFSDWISHLQTALPDIEDIRTFERPDDKHRYLVFHYRNGLTIPSWLASDGTLRLLALTLPAYLPVLSGVYLIEEPENGIHPRAVETMTQSLSNVYDAQILTATHSPIILSMVEPHQVLCFAKNEEGAADVVAGDEHSSLADWKGETDLGILFAAGVLG